MAYWQAVEFSWAYFDCIDRSLWMAVCDRLNHAVVPRLMSPQSAQSVSYTDFPVVGLFEGIIAHLTKKHNGNVHDKGIVEITTSSLDGGNPAHHGKNVVDYSGVGHFGTAEDGSPWICFNFRSMRIILTHYTILSDKREPRWRPVFLRSWVVEVSNDGADWTEVDRRSDCSHLKGPEKTAIFKVPSEIEGQFVRIRVLAVHDSDRLCLEMKAIEFFGTLITRVQE
jgi:hypothetical protein